jgi:hypothetical protein
MALCSAVSLSSCCRRAYACSARVALRAEILLERGLSAVFVGSTSRPRLQASSASEILSRARQADAERYQALIFRWFSRNVDAQSRLQAR